MLNKVQIIIEKKIKWAFPKSPHNYLDPKRYIFNWTFVTKKEKGEAENGNHCKPKF